MIKNGDSVVFHINNEESKEVYKVISDEYQFNGEGRSVVDLEGYPGEVAVEYLEKVIEFDTNNQLRLTSDEVLKVIDKESKVTVILGNGFNKNSDTEDVFRGLMGDYAFDESEEMLDAIELNCELKHTFFLSNAKTETPFNERGSIKRILKDNFWTKLIFHDQPLKNGMYAVVIKD